MENPIVVIKLNVQFQEKIVPVQLKTNQKLRKIILFIEKNFLMKKECFKIYHNDRELCETDAPSSVNLTNDDTILVIKHIREGDDEVELNMATEANQSSAQDNMDAVQNPDSEDNVPLEINDVPTFKHVNCGLYEEVQSPPNDLEENSTKARLFSTLDSLLMDIGSKDGTSNDAIYCAKPITQAEQQHDPIQSEQIATQHEAERSELIAKLKRMQLEHAAQIEAIKSNNNESLVVANQKIEQLKGQIDELKNEHAIDVNRHVENAIHNAKIMHEQMQNEKVQELEKRCQELQIELQNKEKKINEDSMTAIDSAKSQCAQIKLNYERQIQEMNEVHKQSRTTLFDKITELKNTCAGEMIQYNHVRNDASSDAVGESALIEQMNQLQKNLTETKQKYEFDIVQLKVAFEEEQKRQGNFQLQEEWRKANMELTRQLNVLGDQLKKQEALYEADYEKFMITLEKRDDEIKEYRLQKQQLMTQFDEQRKAKELLYSQYSQKLREMQQNYVHQLQRIGTDINNGRFAYDDNVAQVNAGVLKVPKMEEDGSNERKPLALLIPPVNDANGQERKCVSCDARAAKKCTMTFCNSACMKAYFKKHSE